MIEAFREGGWGMYPTLVFGILLVAAAVRYAVSPERRVVPLLWSLGVVTLSSGLLGFVTGIITTASYVETHGNVASGERALLSLYGFGESLNNVGLALVIVTLAALATCVGTFRIARGTLEPLPAE